MCVFERVLFLHVIFFPFLGGMGSLPPGEGGLNPDAGFSYMWHSHNERELVNNDVFPGGMMTMLIVEAPSTTIIE